MSAPYRLFYYDCACVAGKVCEEAFFILWFYAPAAVFSFFRLLVDAARVYYYDFFDYSTRLVELFYYVYVLLQSGAKVVYYDSDDYNWCLLFE